MGDYIVYVYYGVGWYLGVEILEVGDIYCDYIKL